MATTAREDFEPFGYPERPSLNELVQDLWDFSAPAMLLTREEMMSVLHESDATADERDAAMAEFGQTLDRYISALARNGCAYKEIKAELLRIEVEVEAMTEMPLEEIKKRADELRQRF